MCFYKILAQVDYCTQKMNTQKQTKIIIAKMDEGY